MPQSSMPAIGEMSELSATPKPQIGLMEPIEEPSFLEGVKAGLTAQPGDGVGHFIGSAIPAGVGGALGSIIPGGGTAIGAALGEAARQTAGAIVNPEAAAKQSKVGLAAQVMGAGVGQKAGEVAAPAIGAAVSKAGGVIKSATDWLGSRIGKSFLKASKSINSYGHLPEKAIKEEKIVAVSWDDLVDKAKAARHDVGQEMDDLLAKAEKDTLANVEDVVSPIDDALAEANKFPTENATLITRLEGLKKDTLSLLTKGAKEGKMLNTDRANSIKKSLYRVTKYKGTDSDEIPLNKIKQDVARNLSRKIEDVTPEIKPLNERYGNLVALENAATNRAIVASRSDIIGLPEMFGVGIAATGNIGPGAAVVVGNRLLKTPLGGTAGIRATEKIGSMATAPAISRIAEMMTSTTGGAFSAAILDALNKVSPEEIKAEYKSGKLDKATAAQMLRENHGFQ